MNPTPGWRFAAHWTASSVHGSFTVTVKAEKAAVSADRPLFSPKRNSAEAPLQGDEMQRSSMRLKGLSQRLRRGRELKWGGAQARVAPLVSACLFVSINTIQSAAKRGRRERRAYSPSGLVAYVVNAGPRRREFGDVFPKRRLECRTMRGGAMGSPMLGLLAEVSTRPPAWTLSMGFGDSS